MTEWAQRIQKRRQEIGMSVRGLARACNIQPPSVHNWEGGRTKKIEGQNLIAAARALRVSPEWILTGRGEISPSSGNAPPVENAAVINPALLACAITEAATAFRRARRLPSDQALAAAAVAVYQSLVAGRALVASRRAVEEALRKAGSAEPIFQQE